uniref:Uncharacterized protein n=1 Tax=Plectus sambesii TaxID=2011161 RepID=A0A914UH72_9BILA
MIVIRPCSDLAYVATSGIIVSGALCVLSEQDRLPARGGVFTPAIAFKDTSLIDRLAQHGVTYQIVENAVDD